MSASVGALQGRGGIFMNSANSKEFQIKAAQIEQLYSQSGVGALGASAGGLVLTWFLRDVVDEILLIFWLASYLSIHLIRRIIVLLFYRIKPSGPEIIKWGTVFELGAFLGCLWWGAAAVIFFHYGSSHDQFLLAVCVTGISTAAVAVFCATNAYLPCVVAGLLPLSAVFMVEGGPTNTRIGMTILLFMAVLIYIGKKMHDVNAESLSLRFNKDELIDSLSSQKEQLEQLNNDLSLQILEREFLERGLIQAGSQLETKVDERTRQLTQANELLQEKIVEMKGVQSALRESEARYRELVENAPLGIFYCDIDGKILQANPRLKQIFGKDCGSGKSPMDLLTFYPMIECGIAGDLKKCLESGRSVSKEYCYCSENCWNIFLLVHLAAKKSASGSITGVQGMVEDITDKKLFESELHASNERFKKIFEAALDCIFVKNVDLCYTHVNAAFRNLFGWSEYEIIGKTDDDLFPAEYAAESNRVEKNVLNGKTIETEQTIVVLSQSITLNFVRFPLLGSLGQIVGICCIARDITERVPSSKKGYSSQPDKYQSEAIRETLGQVKLAAQTQSVVLLTGESGCGKDYLSRFVHEWSPRAGGPYVTINCAALSPELVESELFGHEAGAYTGSKGRKRGLLELAEGGTLLLNEVGELTSRIQSKLLTFLDTQTFIRVGGEKEISVNVRLIAATNRDLVQEVQDGVFRRDLFYRLNVFSIEVPPLRRRKDDIPILIQEILGSLSTKMGLAGTPQMDAAALKLMINYDWPGNVRELRNVLERSVILSRGYRITTSHLPELEKEGNGLDLKLALNLYKGRSLHEAVNDAKRAVIGECLRQTDGNLKEAADALGITRDSLKHQIKALKIKK